MRAHPQLEAIVTGDIEADAVPEQFREEMAHYLDDDTYIVIHSMDRITVEELGGRDRAAGWVVKASLYSKKEYQ